jgi:hypothetical protein
MSGKRRQHRQRFSRRDLAQLEYPPLWDDVEESSEDFEDEWDDDESLEETGGFWEDFGDELDLARDAWTRSRH